MGIQPKSEISALPGRIFRQGITGCGGSRTHVTARMFVPGPGMPPQPRRIKGGGEEEDRGTQSRRVACREK